MDNVKGYQKALAIIIAATCMLFFSFGTVFAADETSSPYQGKEYKGKKNGVYVTTSTTESEMTGVTKKTVKKKVIPNTTTVDGENHTTTSVAAESFTGCKKLKVVKIKAKYLTKFSSDAFKGLKAKQVKKIKVKVTKKMSKKNFKSLKKQLIAAGIKAKNISRCK